MNTAAATEIKRKGIGVLDKALEEGPVWIIKKNCPAYVVLTCDAYRKMEEAATVARVEASEEDLRAGRVMSGTADALMAALAGE
jgi:PHD/YefM family antitoxin component YafN of YafNO toxin-antitoxin module